MVIPADLEHEFRRVYLEQMQDVPIVNPALEVAAVGFRDWQGYELGVMLTPWFMNLMLLPGEHEPWPTMRIGDAREYAFPSGRYEFLLGEQQGIGRYLACSLFSPVFEFEDQVGALATAEAVLEELFKAENLDRPAPGTPLGAGVEDGERSGGDEPGRGSDPAPAPAEPRAVSRRAFLRGEFLGGRQ